MDCFKVEKCYMVRRVQIWHSCWKSRMPCPPGLRGGRPSLACFGRHYEFWKVYKGFRETNAPLQVTSISWNALCIAAGQCKTAAITTTWLHSRRVRVLNWPACSPDLSLIENIWRIIKRKIHQRRPQTLQQLETDIRQEWDQIQTSKLQKHITSMPRHLQTVLKRRGDATPW